RRILTAIKIAAELERMGDHARHLSKRARAVTDSAFTDVLPMIQDMAELGISMVHDGLTAFIDDDEAAAVLVAARDDEIDGLHKKVYKKILNIMRDNPELIEKGMELVLVNRFLERLGDHVTNMCESIVFSRRAEHVELNK
ncbi:MAG: phosphate transport system regulatory protein PhoU, partial [Spirochaetaceae bacterium]